MKSLKEGVEILRKIQKYEKELDGRLKDLLTEWASLDDPDGITKMNMAGSAMFSLSLTILKGIMKQSEDINTILEMERNIKIRIDNLFDEVLEGKLKDDGAHE